MGADYSIFIQFFIVILQHRDVCYNLFLLQKTGQQWQEPWEAKMLNAYHSVSVLKENHTPILFVKPYQ